VPFLRIGGTFAEEFQKSNFRARRESKGEKGEGAEEFGLYYFLSLSS
jgi:hypothetical protein